MNSPNFWSNLFNPAGFMPRRICGIWSPGLIWLHNASDFFIWTAYLAIPIVLVSFAWKRRQELPFRQVFWLFGVFILACGTTHLMDIVMFYYPIYRFAGLVKLVTAAASWGTVAALIPIMPRALAMRSPEQLQREIDEREKAEAEVRRLNEDLEERVRIRTAELEAANRAKDEFLMTLSHELRTPLTAIQGWASILREEELSTEILEHALDAIERNTWAQTRIVNDILETSKTVTGKVRLEAQPVLLSEVVKNAFAAVVPTFQAKNVALETHLEDPTLQVSGDATRLQQVVWNLLSNAAKFTPAGGTVELTLRRAGEMAELRVQDNGAGVAPDFLPHVFERFRQADSSSTRPHGGLGLGLAIVRHLVELHGGTVRAESEGLGHGAAFTVLLPIVEDRKG